MTAPQLHLHEQLTVGTGRKLVMGTHQPEAELPKILFFFFFLNPGFTIKLLNYPVHIQSTFQHDTAAQGPDHPKSQHFPHTSF